MTRTRLIVIVLTLALLVGLLGACAGGATGPGKIAFEGQTSETVSNIYLINPDGTGQSTLVEGPGWSGTPAISPDGKRLLYSAEVEGDAEIFVMDMDGKNKQQLTKEKGSDIMPGVVARDGKRVAFISSRLYKAPLSAGNVEVEVGMEVYVMNIDGSDVLRLTTNSADVSVYPDWAPDGKTIAYMNVTEVPAINLVAVSATPGEPRNLTADTTLAAWMPKWSPDGKYIYFMGDNNTKKDIYRMDADGKNLSNLTANFTGMCADPGLSPDGKQIAFASDKDGGVNLYIMNLADKKIEALTKGPENTYARPSWGK